MTDQKLEMGRRYNELRAEGKSGPEATEVVNKEFQANIKYATLRAHASRAKKENVSAPTRSEHASGSQEIQAEPTKLEDELRQIGADLDERIRAVAREVFQEMIQNAGDVQDRIIDRQDEPPEPEYIRGAGKGRRQDRDYVKATFTIDRVLWDLFTAERDKRKVSSGRMADIILWRYFDRPKLSYELPKRSEKKPDPSPEE